MNQAPDESMPVSEPRTAQVLGNQDNAREEEQQSGGQWPADIVTIELKTEVDDSFALTPSSIHLTADYLLTVAGRTGGLGFEELGVGLQETIERLRPYGPTRALAELLIARARALREYADNETILSHILEAIAIYEKLDAPRDFGRAFVTLGTVLRDGKLYYDALTALQKGRELLAPIDDAAGIVFADYDEAQICLRLRLYEEAIRLLERAERGLSSVPRPERLQMGVLASRAQIQEVVGANAAGLESAEALVRLVNGGGREWTASDRSQASHIRAGMRWRSGESREALKDYIGAAEDGLQGILRNATLRYRAGERRRLDPIYQAGLHAAFETGELEVAFGLLERSKTIVGTMTRPAGLVETMRSESWQHLRGDASELREQALAAVSSGDTAALRSAQEAAEWLVARRDLLLANEQRDTVEGPALHELAAWVQRALPADTLVLEYVRVNDALWGLALSCESVTAERINPGIMDLALLAASFRYECEGLLEVHALNCLGRCLLEPFGERLAGASSVIVVPPTVLADLPFHAIPLSGVPLIETHDVIYVPSAVLLARTRPVRLRRAITRQSRCAVFCVPYVSYLDVDDLPGALDEATMVKGFFDAPDILMGADATSERLLGLSPEVRVLHVACHAEFESEAPLLGRLLLADRPVFAFEIMLLGLDVDLVNLNACKTAAARVHLGGEAEGLTSAFAAAGAETVLASCWAVDDAPAYEHSMMFYRELLSERHPSPWVATRIAQLTLKSRPETAHPSFWSPFTTVGLPALEGAL